MTVNFFIAGGTLKIHKTAYAQEMLIQKSLLRLLLCWRSAGESSNRHPLIDEADNDGMITIHFNNTQAVHLGEDPGELLGALKKKYRRKIKGRITCRGYMSAFTISLDSDDDEIQYIM